MLLAAIVLPGAAVLLAVAPRGMDRPVWWGTALALSPGLLGLTVTVLVLARVDLARASALALAGCAALAAGAMLVRARRARSQASSAGAVTAATGRWATAAFAWALLAALGVGLFPMFSEWWRVYSDAWNHFGILRSIVERGLPPTDPFFAGVRLQYAWVYHVYTAAVRSLTGIDPLALMAAWSSVSLASLVLSVASLGRRLNGAPVAVTLALVLFGLNALFPEFSPVLLIKAELGQVRGWAEVQRTFGLVPFGSDRVGTLLRGLDGQDYFLNKFMVATPFSMGLALMASWAASFERWMSERGRAELVLAALLTLCAGALHPVVGLHLAMTTGGLAALALVLGPRLGLDRTTVLPWGIASIAGFVPAALFILTLLGGPGGTHREFPLNLSPYKLMGMITCLALGFLFVRGPALALWRRGGPSRAWVVWLALGVLLGFTFRLPGGHPFYSVDKFSYLIWIPLAITAAPGLAGFLARRSSWARAALLAVLFVPVNALSLASRVADPATRERQPWNQPGIAWMRANLPRDAVLVVPNGDWDTGNLVGRDQYMSMVSLVTQLGYPVAEIEARRALCERFFAAESLDTADHARLAALGRPVYAVWTDFTGHEWRWTPGESYRHGAAMPARPRPSGRARAVYESATHEVLELIPPRGGASTARGARD